MSQAAEPQGPFRSGMVAIAGAPNAGKSTLLNRILGTPIAITSPKPQTTRNRILGVLHRPGAQIVFIDTPGIFEARDRLNTRIVEAALGAIADADLVLAVVDAARPDPRAEAFLVGRLKARGLPVVLALNKIDLIADKKALLGLIDRWARELAPVEIVPISATAGTQVEELLQALAARLPAGPPYYPEETLTDATERFIAAELIREKIFHLTGEEIPYATAVTIEAYQESEGGRRVAIEAVIHLERESQKGIVIGKGGAMLKKIGTAARQDIERLTGAKVFLKLLVRVQKNWRKDPKAIERFGY